MAGRAMRVLGLAERELPDGYAADDLEAGYVFMGLIGPGRPDPPGGARRRSRRCTTAGIRTVMITGDQALTAVAVARELRLSRRGSLHVLEAGDLASIDAETLRGLVRDVGIFARVPPGDEAGGRAGLPGQRQGRRDDRRRRERRARRCAPPTSAWRWASAAPSWPASWRTSCSRTDDFAQMVDAVDEGRLVRANVRRVLHYMLSTNASEVWVVVGAVAVGLPSPLTPLQLLWLNLVTDIAPGLGAGRRAARPGPDAAPAARPAGADHPAAAAAAACWSSPAVIAAGGAGAFGIGVHAPWHAGRSPRRWRLPACSGHSSCTCRWRGRVTAGDRRQAADRTDRCSPGMALSAGLQLVALFFPPLRAALGGAALAAGRPRDRRARRGAPDRVYRDRADHPGPRHWRDPRCDAGAGALLRSRRASRRGRPRL